MKKYSKYKKWYSNEKQAGLTKRQKDFTYHLIKGRIAETLIEELFVDLGYSVFRYGMENTIPGIMKLLEGIRSDVELYIKRMPDFVIQKPTGEVYFIEVKFRANEKFDKSDSSIKDYPYENAHFVVVSKKHIKCITYKELQEGKEITPKCHNYLGNRKEFKLDKKKIIDFCGFAVKFFANV